MEHLIAPLLFMLGAFICGAIGEGISDGERAIDNNPVEHRVSASMRVFLALALASVMAWVKGFPWWDVPLLAIAGLAAFNPVFRYTMNKRRGLDWRYVSPSNKYDFFFFWIGSRPGMGLYFGALFDPKTRKAISESWVSKGYHAGWQPWIIWSHRGGTIAYLFELSILALSTWGYFHFTNT